MGTMTARYAGTCAKTGRAIKPGDTIEYDRRTRRAALIEQVAPDAGPDEGRYISSVIVIGGREFYRNKRGRCEDAPCCGCCTI